MNRVKRKKEKSTLQPYFFDDLSKVAFKTIIDALSLLQNSYLPLLNVNLPHFGDVPEINKFFETADPKYITKAIRKNLLYLHDQRIHTTIEYCKQWRSDLMRLKHEEGLEVVYSLKEWCDEVRDAISNGLKTDENYRRPHKVNNPLLTTPFCHRWKAFHDKGTFSTWTEGAWSPFNR